MPINILIVDDEPELVEIIADCLNVDDRYNIETYTDSKVALEKIRLNKYDAILTDYRMPGLDGEQLLTIVREECEKNNQTPFLIISAFISEVKHLENISNVYFLGKPINEDELQKIVSIVCKISTVN